MPFAAGQLVVGAGVLLAFDESPDMPSRFRRVSELSDPNSSHDCGDRRRQHGCVLAGIVVVRHHVYRGATGYCEIVASSCGGGSQDDGK
jgi:hypothetical protein